MTVSTGPPQGPPPTHHVLAKNTFANGVYFGMQLLVGFFTVPFLVRQYGTETFGAYALLLTIGPISLVLNSAISMSLMRFVPMFIATRDFQSLRSIVAKAYAVAVIFNAVLALGLGLVILRAPGFLGVSAADQALLRDLAVLLLPAYGLTGAAAASRGILAALQRFGLMRRLDMVIVLGPVLGMGGSLLFGFGIRGFAAVYSATMILGGILQYLGSRRVLPEVPHIPSFRKQGGAPFFRFSLYQLGNQLSDVFFYTSDKFVLQKYLGTGAVGQYSVLEKPTQLFFSLMSLPLATLVPAGAKAYAEDDRYLADRLILAGSKIYTAAVLPPTLLLMLLMKPFLAAWVGPSFVHLAPLAQLYLLAALTPIPFKVFGHMVLGKGVVRPQVILKLIYAPINLGASILLVQTMGIAGVIVPSTVFWVLISPGFWVWLMRREGVDLRQLWRQLMPVFAWNGLGLAAIAALHQMFPAANSAALLLYLVLGLLVLYLAVFFGSLGKSERRMLLLTVQGFHRVKS